jgi:histidine triad (HIT) family protein
MTVILISGDVFGKGIALIYEKYSIETCKNETCRLYCEDVIKSGELLMDRFYFWVIRTIFGRKFARWGWVYMNRFLPVERLFETDQLIAFRHPHPAYPFHVLLVPKRGYKDIFDLPVDSSDFFRDLVTAVKFLVREFHLEDGFRLITNGGTYQDIPLLHFHLVAGESEPKAS